VPFSEGKPDFIFCNKINKSYMHVHNRCKRLIIQRENSNYFLSTCTQICLRILAIYISLLAKFLMVGANSFTISQLAKHCSSLAVTISQLAVSYGRVWWSFLYQFICRLVYRRDLINLLARETLISFWSVKVKESRFQVSCNCFFNFY
jgi:hypothetical protein